MFIVLILFGFLIFFISVILFLILCVTIIITIVKKKPFSKRLLFAALSGFILVSSFYVYEVYFFTFARIDKEYIQNGPGPLTSTDGAYTANAYYEPYGGATGGVNVWVDITYNDMKGKIQTVYYSDAKSNFSMEWLDADTLSITNDEPDFSTSNRSIKLKIGKEIYDEKGWACKSLVMKNKYETCFQH